MTFRPLSAPVDYILLGGQRSPGVAEIQSASTPRDFDRSRGHGVSGATLRYRGNGLAEFKVLLRLYTEQHWTDWHEWKDTVQRPVPGVSTTQRRADRRRQRAPALVIEHPILEDLGIRSVVVTDVLQPVQTADGEWTIEIRFLEYREAQRALGRVQGSETNFRQGGHEDQTQVGLRRLTDVAERSSRGESVGLSEVRDILDGALE